MAKYSEELKGVVRALYLRRYTPKEIASELNLPNARIVYYWAEKYSWADLLSFESTEEAIERRYQLLASRDNKTDLDLKEMDMLIAHATKLRAQSNKHKEKMASGQSNGQAAARDSNSDEPRPKRKNRKNDISSLTQADFDSWAEEHLFEYQKHLRRNIGQQVRNILKSRQIGATWYFAFEAFENAVMTGDPQIFLSASKVQAEYFRSYIVNIAEQYFGITLTGNPIRLSNGAELRFLSTNKNTAQSYSGHLYCDEYFWVPNFARLNEVASAMATHDKWRTTYFSTPSAKTHQAYPFWTGEEWKQGSKNARPPSSRPLMKCATADGFARMGSGAMSSRWRMPLQVASTWPTSRSCATDTTRPPSTCSICACSWTARIPYSAFQTWKPAAWRWTPGRITTRTLRGHLVTGQYGEALTRHAAAICRVL
ncbi:putative phage gene [Citrobacter freundii]|uniref:Phage protein n=1 Tax=Citrobacter freundii TaxID=546 RepID=A0A7G2IYV4_CITFR|nr:putative phage gene [Citrobacter freundii]